MAQVRDWTEIASQCIEALAVVITLSFIVVGTVRWLLHPTQRIEGIYERYRVVLGKALQAGLELLVATDIIRTVTVELALLNIGLPGALAPVRTAIG